MDETKLEQMELLSIDEKKNEPAPSVSIPLEEGEVEETMDLDEFARKLAQELHRVKSIISDVSVEEIGARIEECKIAMCMYKNLFEILVDEHTKRINVKDSRISEITE